jgi:hypothetical protein
MPLPIFELRTLAGYIVGVIRTNETTANTKSEKKPPRFLKDIFI